MSTLQPIEVDWDKCRGCGLCLLACPTDVFRLNEQNKAVPVFASDCHVCHQCEDDCPSQAIHIAHTITSSRKASIYDQPGIYLNTVDWSRDPANGKES
jgi:NAD-dependent dihydropyrimidine dehydrogenase PreA subunit